MLTKQLGIIDEDLDVIFEINNFSLDDCKLLHKLQPFIEDRLPTLTELFYHQLLFNDKTSSFLEGRVETLRHTHLEWLKDIFRRDFNQEYIDFLKNIGIVHATLNIPSSFITASMCFIRSQIPMFITEEDATKIGNDRAILASSAIKMIDINQFIIDRSYYNQLMKITGFI